jgi:hypothetical protein
VQCPIKILAVDHETDRYQNFGSSSHPIILVPGGHTTRVQVENTSNKDVVGVKYMSAMYDATNDLSGGPKMTSDRKIKAGKKIKDSFDDAYYYRSRKQDGGVKVWVQKVAFADGTSWEDGGQKSCAAVDKRGKQRSIK